MFATVMSAIFSSSKTSKAGPATTTQGDNTAPSNRVRPPPPAVTHGGDSMEEWQVEVGRPEMERKDAEIRRLVEELHKLEDGNRELKKELHRANHQTELLQTDLQSRVRQTDQLTERCKRMVDLWGTRTQELASAQTFLTKEDAFSGEEVMRLVQALNNETLQAAAYIADSFGFEQVKDGEEGGLEELQEAGQRTGSLLGDEVVCLLQSTKHLEDPLVLEVAIQSSIALCCRCVSAWFVNDPPGERFVAQILDGIRESG